MNLKKEKEIKVIYAVVLGLFLAFLAVPMFRLLGESFVAEYAFSLKNYAEVIGSRGFLGAFVNSIFISAVSALTATLLAFFSPTVFNIQI